MAKRLTEKQKNEISKCFNEGETIEIIAGKYNCTKLTISRNLKKILGEKKYKELLTNRNVLIQNSNEKEKDISKSNLNNRNNENLNREYSFKNNIENSSEEEPFHLTEFMELTPLNYEIDNVPQKDLSSIPIEDIQFPKVVYMIVDKKIELETKYLKEYPDWQFLSKDELNRKTIEIYEDLKDAKRLCKKEQKVIKVPNTTVFKIVAPLLISRGISRIVNSDKLIAL